MSWKVFFQISKHRFLFVYGIAFNNFSIIWDDYDGDVVTIANCKELSIVIKSIHMQKMEKEVQNINVIKKYRFLFTWNSSAKKYF